LKDAKKQSLGLNGLDELFMTDRERAENKLPRIYDIPLSEIDDFPDHPFKVRMDEDMDLLVQSVKERGVIVPITLREKEDGRYELVSGHRRKKACELAGFDTIRAEIRDLTRDEAIILMVESNLQRSVILPSEKAFSYKMRLDAMNRQGHRTDLDSTLRPVGAKSRDNRSDEQLAEACMDSARQIQRYIRLTELIPPLLDMVDDGRIGMRPAVELSYLSKESQTELAEIISFMDATPSHDQTIRMRKMSDEGKLTSEAIEAIMNEIKPNQREKISFRADRIRQYLPQNIPKSQTEEYVIQALSYYSRFREQQRAMGEAR
jgi:ParB family chromosome partitioning protein